jgi:hypothetical protein
VGIEEDETAGGNLQRTWFALPLVLEIDQVLSELALADQIGRLFEVGGHLPHSPEVRLLRPLGKAGQLKILVHALTKCGGHE